MFKSIVICITAALALSLGACSTFIPHVDMPEQTSVRQAAPSTQMAMASPTGSLYSPATFRPLFEDQRARFVGDILTIQISEQINAAQANSMSASRSDSTSIDVPLIQGFFGGSRDLRAMNASASSSKDFSGDGASSASNKFTGTLTVTVSEILPNGNLFVVGEKQIGTNREVEFLKFSGVINPVTIGVGNVVPSSKVADARMEYRGKGTLDSATAMGWLSRFFLTALPF